MSGQLPFGGNQNRGGQHRPRGFRGGNRFGRGKWGTIATIVIAGIAWWTQQQNQGNRSSNRNTPSKQTQPYNQNSSGSSQNTANASRQSIEGRCTSVTDGDTIKVADLGGKRITVRIKGIDTMEPHNLEKAAKQGGKYRKSAKEIVALGKAASTAARKKLANQKVTLVMPLGREERDPYNRMLAYVEVNGEDYGEWILKQGLAEARREPHPRKSSYFGMQDAAKKARIGIFK